MNQQTEELKRQQNSGLYAKEQAAEMGRMVGAQYRLEGNIISIVKQVKDVEGRVLQAQPAALEHPQRAARVVRRERNPQDHQPLEVPGKQWKPMKRKYGAALKRETAAEQQMRERAAEMKDNRFNYGSKANNGLPGARQAPRPAFKPVLYEVSIPNAPAGRNSG